MPKRKKQFNDGPLVLKHAARWQELAKPAQNVRFLGDFSSGTFLGFRLIKQNINQLWRWDTLEDINDEI